MRIIHIVTLFSPDNSYGGPLTVALNQARELGQRGHEVEVVTAVTGFTGHKPKQISDVPIRAFQAKRIIPNIGFAGLCSPGMLIHLYLHIKRADVVHVHLARDLVVAPAALVALLKNVPVVVQTHGMIDESERYTAKMFDCLIIKRVMNQAMRILWLTPEEEKSLKTLFPTAMPQLERIYNGVSTPPKQFSGQNPLEKTADRSPMVVYIARLQRRKRPEIFARAAAQLISRGVNASFQLYGPDEGSADVVCEELSKIDASHQAQWHGPLQIDDVNRVLNTADIFCLPSVHEPFPMSVLEAMAQGLPVVITSSCGLAPFVDDAGAGIVVGHEQSAITEGLEKLILDKALRISMGRKAQDLVRNKFSIHAVVKQLERIYSEVSGSRTISKGRQRSGKNF